MHENWPSQAPPMLNEGDIRYLLHGNDCVRRWVEDMASDDPFPGARIQASSVRDQLALHDRILRGDELSPWHVTVPEDYARLMGA